MLPTQLVVSTGGEYLAVASWEAVEGQKYSLWVSAPVATTVQVVFNAPAVSQAEAAAAQLDATPVDATQSDGRLFRASAIVTRADDAVRLHLTVLCGSRGVHELQEPQEQELSVTVSVEPHEPQEQEQESDDSHGDEAILFMLLDTGA